MDAGALPCVPRVASAEPLGDAGRNAHVWEQRQILADATVESIAQEITNYSVTYFLPELRDEAVGRNAALNLGDPMILHRALERSLGSS